LGPSGAGDLAGMMRLDLIFGGEAESRFRLRVIILVLCVSGLLLDYRAVLSVPYISEVFIS
jgi:hypothetical protein